MNTWIVQLGKGLLELCVLNFVQHGESYGYEIIQELQKLEELSVSESTLYPILTRLRKDGLLKVRAVASKEGPPRRYYALTAAGMHRIREMNDYWAALNQSLSRLIKGHVEVK